MTGFEAWLGNTRTSESALDGWPSQALQASLGEAEQAPYASLPMLWHWLYFLDTPQRALQGEDGHPRRGDFYPPITNPRRMFVGARTRVLRPLRLRVAAQLEETVLACEHKRGGSGELTLLTVGYCYRQQGEVCIEEQRDFMYLPARQGEAVETLCQQLQPIPEAQWARNVETDPVLLFKFSALTFNGHRIHYDRDYARHSEAYPDLVVHGPLSALLLAGLASERSAEPLHRFSFRAQAPLFVGDVLRLRANLKDDDETIALVAYRPDGRIAMTAEAS